MTYTFVGLKDFIDIKLNELSLKFDVSNILNYDIETNSIEEVIIDLNTVSLFGDKLVIVKNINKLDNYDSLINYLKNKSNNTLVLISYNDLDKRKKITKILKEKTNYTELWEYNINSIIKEKLDGYDMKVMAINALVSYCNNDVNRVLNELEKLKLYKGDNKVITVENVELIVKKSYDATIFELIDEINKKNTKKVFKIYNELLLEGDDEEKILYTMANHYRLLFQISVKRKEKSDEELLKEYKMHPYRLKKLKEQLNLISDEEILFILKGLSDVDISVKSGRKDIKTAMILFFNNL